MKAALLLVTAIFTLTVVAPPAMAQQFPGYPAYSQPVSTPGLVQQPGMSGAPGAPAFVPNNMGRCHMPTSTPPAANGFQPQQFGQTAYAAQAPRYIAAQPVGAGAPGPQGGSMDLRTMSPYQQQEKALEESRMMSQLEELKKSHEADESFRNSGEFQGSARQSQAQAQQRGSGKLKSVLGGMGKLVKGSMRAAAPAAGFVGAYFLIRAACPSPTYIVPGGGMGMGGTYY